MPPPEPILRPLGSATASVFVFGGSERFSSSMRALVACNSLAAVTTTSSLVAGGFGGVARPSSAADPAASIDATNLPECAPFGARPGHFAALHNFETMTGIDLHTTLWSPMHDDNFRAREDQPDSF